MMNSMLQKQMFEKFNCEKCRFSTKDPNKYRNHVSLHNDIKYACSHCDFVSYTKTEFQRHLVTHTGKFPYTCGYCGYGAIRNDYIVKHIRRIHGDGKILCSVSTIENESKKASINITQTHLIASSVQNILQNSPSSEDIIDLTTEMDSIGSSSNVPNGNNIAGHVEVEVISPVDQQLYPWIPLTVVAPSSFRVPPNCIAQVIEVKPVNSACHLVLKCLDVVESTLPNQPVKSEHIYEQKPSKSDIPSKNIEENSDGPSLQDCAVLQDDCQANMLSPSNALCEPIDDLHTNATCPIDDPNEVTNAVDANTISDDLEEFSGGPIISAVFSLSSDSQNTIEGIEWDCPFSSPNSSQLNEKAPNSSLNPPAIQKGPIVCDSELNMQMDIDKSQNVLKSSVLESENAENVKESIDAKIQLSTTLVPIDVKKYESQPYVPQKSRKGGRISNRLGKLEANIFSKPQTLFLSCDKRIVMQPLSCTMQSNNTPQVGKVTELQFPVKTRKESAKAKVKRLAAPALKGRYQPNMRTLRLHPFKVDQVAHIPCYNQPVVVLNHPDVESVETFNIMKAIRVFGGKIIKIGLSKQMCKYV